MRGFAQISAGFLSLALCFTVASGQTTTATTGTTTTTTTTTTATAGGPTCSAVPTSLTAFSTESTVTLPDVLTATAPNIPANILASITGGAQEIRERVIYNAQNNEVTVTIFLVAPGSPEPTPLSANVTQTTLALFSIAIDKIYQNCTPTPSIMFVGDIISSTGGPSITQGVLGSLVGTPAAISVGYTTANPPVLSNSVILLSGIAVAFSASSSGTVTFPTAPVTPPASSGGPTIILKPAYSSTSGLNQVTQNPIALDASATVGAVTYAWSATPPVSFAPGSANAAVQQVEFPGPGTYTFTLTVTGSGGSSTITFPINFVGR